MHTDKFTHWYNDHPNQGIDYFGHFTSSHMTPFDFSAFRKYTNLLLSVVYESEMILTSPDTEKSI